ncbi:MAG: SMP-30/gluconolactonase/LRE family protein [Fibrobacteria bacterium]
MNLAAKYPLCYVVAALLAQAGWGQDLGTVTLPADIAEPGTKVESVVEGLSYSEGPAFDPQGNLFFSEDPDVNTGRIWKITPDGVKTTIRDPSDGSNGLQLDPQGRLVICQLDTVCRLESDGSLTSLVASGSGLNLARVNDLSIGSTGAMFFTNLQGGTVFFRTPEGDIKTSTQFLMPNGVEWIEEKSIVYIAAGKGLSRCAVNNATGAIGTCQEFAGSTDGLTTDANGNVYRASWGQGSIIVHDSTGQQLGTIAINAKEVTGKTFFRGQQGNACNCVFGGADGTTLYITGDGGCYRIKLKIPGRVRPQSNGIRIQPIGRKRIALNRQAEAYRAAGIYFLDAEQNRFGLSGRWDPLPRSGIANP